MEHNKDQLNGISGWLILVAIVIILSPVRLAVLAVPIYSNIFIDGTWELLTSPFSKAYSPLSALMLISEITINICLYILWVYIAIIFFLKKSFFPKVFIATLLFSLAFIIIEAFAINLVLPNKPIFDPETTQALIHSLITSAILIPYMLKSKRVQATFVNY